MRKTTKRVNEQRPKAFIGAAISAAAGIASGILSSISKKKEEARQKAINRNRIAHETNVNQADSINENLANLEQNKEAMREQFENKFMRNGGKTSKSSELSPRKGVVPNIAEGGTAIPIKKNTYLLKGRKHETGGIVIGKGKKSIEAEGDEVVQITPKNLKVFSAQPIINGNSPAELVQRGVKPDKVFNAQERFKDINGLNDDGTRKKKVIGGKDEVKQDNTRVYRPEIIEPIERKVAPADRVNAPVGTKYSDLSPEDKFRLKRSDAFKKDYQGLEGSSPEFDVALAAATGGLSGLYKASASAGRRTGANLVKGFAKGTGKELAYDVATRVASEINPTLGLVTGLIPRSGGVPATKATKTTKAATRAIESKGTTKAIEATTRAAKPAETTNEVTKIAGLLESPEKMTRDQLKKINAVAKRFGYKPIPLDYAKDRAKAEKAVKDLVNQHNTFLRGVRPLTLEERYYVGKELKKQGLEVNEDNIYKHAVTHTVPPITGAGRADIPDGIEGALYTSNSGNQSVGYANKSKFNFSGEIEGIIGKVRRPTKFNSPRMTDWWVDNDFNFANEMSYYQRKLLDENIAKYGKLPDNIRNEIKSSEDAIFNTRLKEFESGINNARYYNDIIHSRMKYIDEKNLSKPSRAVKYERYNMDNASAIEKIAYGEYLRNIINKGRKKTYSEFLKEERARVTREFRIKAHKKAIKEVAEKQGYKFDPSKANIYYAQYYGLHGTTRNTGNPRQHFIFTGEPGIKKLDFIDYYKPTKEEILTGSRDHDRAVYTEGFSRRTRRLGGTINKNNKIMKLGGNRKKYPTLTGLYHGANEGRAIRSLRELRSNPKYQYQGEDKYLSMKDKYDSLPVNVVERIATAQANRKSNNPSTGVAVKKQSFNSAFAAARKAGLDVFEWNGKKYGTKLAESPKDNVSARKTSTSATSSKVTTSAASSKHAAIDTVPKRQVVIKDSIPTISRDSIPVVSKDSIPTNSRRQVTNAVRTVNTPAKTTHRKADSHTEIKTKKGDSSANKTINYLKNTLESIDRTSGFISNSSISLAKYFIKRATRKADTNKTKKTITSPNTTTSAKTTSNNKSKSNVTSEVKALSSRMSKMIKDNTYVPGQYPSTNNDVTAHRESTALSLYKGIKSKLGVPNRNSRLYRGNTYTSDSKKKVEAKNSKMKLGGNSLIKNNYNNFGLEKDYSSSFAPNALTKANMNSVKTNSVVAGKPVAGTSKGGFKNFMSKTGKGIGNWLNSSGREALSAGIGAVGSIVSALTNKSSIDAIQPANIPTPKAVRPARMKTNYNINPQLSEVTENERNLRRVIDSNTSSSATNIARQQRVANDAVLQRNKLRGTKENIETQLYNQDALNRQEVENRNTTAINEANRYNAISAAQTANEKIQAQANNRTQMIEGLTGAVRDYQLGVDTRRRDDLAFAAEAAKNPEQFDLFMNLMKKHKGAIRQLGFRLGGENKLLCGGRKKVS